MHIDFFERKRSRPKVRADLESPEIPPSKSHYYSPFDIDFYRFFYSNISSEIVHVHLQYN
jgi:hypothetical protein